MVEEVGERECVGDLLKVKGIKYDMRTFYVM